ncbi:uncharacterized protein LOC114254375 [Monomorium pharaonis]|uniref:uncharacterized protein LOC114254375 n=1 Tax=Monomorium pharaonis TaxID=307658 RepID=UPI00102E1D2A|nr:uncharacterized protein LOC114254375 [Monomorium pharaonis]
MCATFKDLLCCYMKPEYVKKKDIQEINPENISEFIEIENIYLGVKILQVLNKDQLKTCSIEKINAFKINCRNFMITGCKEILKRYDFSNPILPKLMWLNPKEALSSNNLRSPTLEPLLCLLPGIVKDEQFQIIDDQWRKMSLTKFPDNFKELSPDKFWLSIKQCEDHHNEFNELCDFALNALLLPHSSAACERVFSRMNSIKTKSRNRLLLSTTKSLLLASQCMNRAGGCGKFDATEEMLNCMRKSTMYPDVSGNALLKPSTSRSTINQLYNEDLYEDIVFEEDC